MTGADELIARAVEATGLDDLGPDGYREGLETYVAALAEEARLNDLGRVAVESAVVNALANRLRVVAHVRAHPDVAEQEIESPLVVIGMFRAGTTFLSNLLDQDPGNRALLRWEAGDSAPPPTPADHRAGPRVDAAHAEVEMLEALNPAVRAIHHEDADGPTECIAVMGQDFKSLSWEAIANVPTYGAWLREADARSAYEYHRLVLQVLQSGGVQGRWTLKSPHHCLALEALTAVHPSARLVLLHRDPVVLSASVCSLISTLSGTFTDADHQAYIAEHWTSMLEESISRIEAFRAAHPEHPVVDVHYADLVGDPVGTVGALSDAVGTPLSAAGEAAMAAYVAAHPQGAHGRHGYDLATYGLDEGQLRGRFSAYVERHGVAIEVPGRGS
ncbi:sulfotransferase [Iamia sp. SCSIO 61187]|uniref:sulfotransferase family protein n=1 Tax=Iamia sp. SCSIO 61187 TaxID=2722752 RepID=UPI001C6370DE|nr:sulfotransferase [Iamia sp. SCSIO 61187]QYG93172.1 sulfotransferase [Iamia sp. SCSIO 61187]